MKRLIKEYTESCEKVRLRMKELNESMGVLRKNGNEKRIKELNLKQRIYFLQTEYRQTLEIIEYMKMYVRRTEQRVETNNIL